MKLWFLILSVVVSVPLSSAPGYSEQTQMALDMVRSVNSSEDGRLALLEKSRLASRAQYRVIDVRPEQKNVIVIISRSTPEKFCDYQVQFEPSGRTTLSEPICEI